MGFPRSSFIIFYHDLTLVATVQGLTARVNFESAKREIFDDLLSREPEDWVHESKREPGRAALATPPVVCTLKPGSPAPPQHKHSH